MREDPTTKVAFATVMLVLRTRVIFERSTFCAPEEKVKRSGTNERRRERHLMIRSIDRILTTHTGSLPRPDSLVGLHLERARNSQSELSYGAALAAAVDEIVRRQITLGVDIVDDGEQSKAGFVAYSNERLGGFEVYKRPAGSKPFAGSRELLTFPEYYEQHSGPGGDLESVIDGADYLQWLRAIESRHRKPKACCRPCRRFRDLSAIRLAC